MTTSLKGKAASMARMASRHGLRVGLSLWTGVRMVTMGSAKEPPCDLEVVDEFTQASNGPSLAPEGRWMEVEGPVGPPGFLFQLAPLHARGRETDHALVHGVQAFCGIFEIPWAWQKASKFVPGKGVAMENMTRSIFILRRWDTVLRTS